MDERTVAKQICRLWFKDADGRPFQITDGQADIFNVIYLRRHTRNQIITATQYGKLLAHDTPVLTTDGWSTHGALKPGDFVFSHEGKPVKVLNVFNDGYANLEMEFSNGEKIRCHDNHEWLVKSDYHKRRGYDWQRIEAKELKTTLHKNYSIPHTAPIQYPKTELPLDPYFVGAWLGDGSSSKPCITGHPKDKAIIDRIPYELSTECTHAETGVVSYYFSNQNIFSRLRDLGLENNKHVPDIYKYSSLQDRLELLAGLIDTDGSVNSSVREKGWRNGRVYIINSNKRIIDDIAEIVTSLGIKPSITKVEPTLSSSGIQGKQPVYYLGFAPYIEIPTVLPRKKIVPIERKRNYRIKKITDIAPVPGRCIEVEGGVYLAGRQLVPTHNSETVAMALIIRSMAFKEDWLILAGDSKKTGIIMGKVIGHLFDNPALEAQIDLAGIDTLERLKHERSRDRITWRNGGEIRALTADARNRKAVKQTLTGQGARNIVQDESALIMDDLQAMTMRMLGGFADSFLLKIGNPFYRNHFFRTWHSDKYHKILIDADQALAEGRFTRTFLDEMSTEPFYDVLYRCEFPAETDIMAGGYQRLITDDMLESAFCDPPDTYPALDETSRIGCDFAGGGNDRSAYVIKHGNLMWLESTNRASDLMTQVAHIRQLIDTHHIEGSQISTDAGGLGQGVGDRLRELEIYTNNVHFGSSAQQKDRFKNQRAEMYYNLKRWIEEGGRIVKDDAWYELLAIAYKTDSERKFQIQPKDELKRRMSEQGLTVTSPDVADAASLCCTSDSMVIGENDFFLG